MDKNDFINKEMNISLKENIKDWYEKCFNRLADIGQSQNSKIDNLQKEEKSLREDSANWYTKCKVRLTDIDSHKSDLNNKNNNDSLSKDNGTWYNKCLTRLFGW